MQPIPSLTMLPFGLQIGSMKRSQKMQKVTTLSLRTCGRSTLQLHVLTGCPSLDSRSQNGFISMVETKD